MIFQVFFSYFSRSLTNFNPSWWAKVIQEPKYQGCARGPSSRGRDRGRGVQVRGRGEAEAPVNLFEARPRHSLPRPRRGTPEVEASSRHLSTSTRPKPRPSRQPFDHCFWTGFNNTELISSFNILSFYFLINNNRQLPVPRMAHLNYTEAMIRTIE